MIDELMTIAFSSAYTAIFEIGSIMAVLMLVFGVLDYRYSDKIRHTIEKRKLDRPDIMLGLALIPVDGTLLFQYNIYRRRSIRFGSLLAGIVGIGEEATYLILSNNPLNWLMLAVIKLIVALPTGHLFNKNKKLQKWADSLQEQDDTAGTDEQVILADENFHELPDKFRHKLHHFRYHQMGMAFWIFFATAFLTQITLSILAGRNILDPENLLILEVPFVSWLAMLALFIVVFYRIVIRMTTREFGKIFEHEFSDTKDAVGDLAETCASIILIIFLVSFAVNAGIAIIGLEQITRTLAAHGWLAVIVAALVGLIPGTAPSLTFTALYITLAGQEGALPFAALAACSIALIGDSQFIGMRQIKFSQKAAHAIAFLLAIVAGMLIYLVEMSFFR